MAETEYEDIETLIKNQNSMLDESLQKQQEITNQQTQMNIDELNRNKEEIDKDVTKTNKALYTEYQKNKNPYGANAEQLYTQGLGNSGYAETTQTNLYNTYQKNITDTLNNARELKSNFDNEISRARQTGDITLAQNALEIYKQKMQLLSQEYELRNNREQYLYQKEQDALAQENWLQEFNRQKNRDKVSDKQFDKTFNYQKSRDKVSDKQFDKTFNYQKSRDKVSDSQWEKEYALSKKASASSSSRRSSSSSKSSNRTTSTVKSNNTQKSVSKNTSSSSVVKSDTDKANKTYTPKEIIANIANIQGPNVTRGIKDGISGKTFATIDELLNYYGYAAIE